jgi:D-arabinose 1-dehydrogenase-like Zn-dependent alcohol dehydrogenase
MSHICHFKIIKSINVVYSTNGRHDAYDKLLAFAALHGVRPVVERFEMGIEGIESAILRLRSGGVRYRGVLVVGGEEEAPYGEGSGNA